jgi:hypothetical protein
MYLPIPNKCLVAALVAVLGLSGNLFAFETAIPAATAKTHATAKHSGHKHHAKRHSAKKATRTHKSSHKTTHKTRHAHKAIRASK